MCENHIPRVCVVPERGMQRENILVNHSEEPLFSVLPGHGGAIIAAVIVVTAGILIGVFLMKRKKRSKSQIPSFLIFPHFRD